MHQNVVVLVCFPNAPFFPDIKSDAWYYYTLKHNLND
jgi:hypothetical protein